MKKLKNLIPYLIISLIVLGYWKVMTVTDNYAWTPKGKEKFVLEFALTSIFIYKSLFWLLIVNLTLFGILSFLKQKNTIGISSICVSVILFITLGNLINKNLANVYYIVFINQSVSEEYINRPIKEAGRPIGKIIVKNITDKQMKNRRYAIGALAEIKYKEAIPILQKIANDTTEIDYIREEAIEVINKLKR